MIDLFPIPGHRLAIALRPRGGDWLLDDLRSLRPRGFATLVSALEASELAELELNELAAAAPLAGVECLRFPIPDLGLPSAAALRQLTDSIIARMSAGEGVAVHCRQGIGRSGLVVAATLVAGGVEAGEAWAIVTAARGRPVPDTGSQREWLFAFARP